jgi:predicted lipoprotein with Yx(FWY)xxD motif
LRRIMITLATVAAIALAVTGVASAGGSRAKLLLRKTKVGTILVNSKGFTVYAFTRDSRNVDRCKGSCATVWPLVTTNGKAIAGPGVKARLIGTITPRRGVHQVTYAGHPLYTYLGDSRPGQTSYVNFFQFGGFWPALNAAGHEVR